MMAYGRMLSKKISYNVAVNKLSCSDSKLAFTWLIAHLDRDGRIIANPDILKAIVFPQRNDVSVQQFEDWVNEWASCKLIILFKNDDTFYLYCPKFKENQKHLRYEREAKSDYPDPEKCSKISKISSGVRTELGRSRSGVTPAEEKRREEKRREENLPVRRSNSGVSTSFTDQLQPSAVGIKPTKIEPSSKRTEEEKKAFDSAWLAFESKYGKIEKGLQKKEAINLWQLINKSQSRDKLHFVDFLKISIEAFWKIKQRRDPKEDILWKQPFLPSALNSAGIWPRILETMRNKREPTQEELDGKTPIKEDVIF